MQTVYANNNTSLIPIEYLVLKRKYIMEIPSYKFGGWVKIVAKVLRIENFPLQPYVTLKCCDYADTQNQRFRRPWAITTFQYKLSEIRNVEEYNKVINILYCLKQKDIILPADVVIDLFNST